MTNRGCGHPFGSTGSGGGGRRGWCAPRACWPPHLCGSCLGFSASSEPRRARQAAGRATAGVGGMRARRPRAASRLQACMLGSSQQCDMAGRLGGGLGLASVLAVGDVRAAWAWFSWTNRAWWAWRWSRREGRETEEEVMTLSLPAVPPSHSLRRGHPLGCGLGWVGMGASLLQIQHPRATAYNIGNS